MPTLPEKSKRKGKPLTANEKQTLRLLIALTATGIMILLSIFSLYFSSQHNNPFEMTSTAISLTNSRPIGWVTKTNPDVARLLTQTAEAFTPAPGN